MIRRELSELTLKHLSEQSGYTSGEGSKVQSHVFTHIIYILASLNSFDNSIQLWFGLSPYYLALVLTHALLGIDLFELSISNCFRQLHLDRTHIVQLHSINAIPLSSFLFQHEDMLRLKCGEVDKPQFDCLFCIKFRVF